MSGKTSNESKAKYNAKAYDRLYPFVPKGWKEEIQAFAESRGESLNEFIVLAVVERMQRLGFGSLKEKPGQKKEGSAKGK